MLADGLRQQVHQNDRAVVDQHDRREDDIDNRVLPAVD